MVARILDTFDKEKSYSEKLGNTLMPHALDSRARLLAKGYRRPTTPMMIKDVLLSLTSVPTPTETDRLRTR
jgi:hypothetical protein